MTLALGKGTHVEGEELLRVLGHEPHQRLRLLHGGGQRGPAPLAWHCPEDEEPFGDSWGGKGGSQGTLEHRWVQGRSPLSRGHSPCTKLPVPAPG